MTLAFTICSINYLAQARALGESLAATNPDVKFVVGLVDVLVAFEADKTPPFELVELHRIGIPNLDWMRKHYDITEINTAAKPFFFQYFIRENPDCQHFIYFDPDILVFTKLRALHEALQQHDIVLTPHTFTPYPDRKLPNEADLLNSGTFNLGFLALAKSENTARMLNWWGEKLATQAYSDICRGLFTDQKWMNFTLHFFRKVFIDQHRGHNVAYWNLHERRLSRQNGQWLVNDTEPLQFFHFSGYGLDRPDEISRYQNRYTFTDRPDVRPLFELYAEKLRQHHNEYYRRFACVYVKARPVIRLRRVRRVFWQPLQTLADKLLTP